MYLAPEAPVPSPNLSPSPDLTPRIRKVLTQSSPGKSKGYDLRADAWSVGIVMHAMLTGYFPFDKGTAHVSRYT